MKITILSLALIAAMAVGCTQQNRAKNWGGTTTVVLPPNTKLVNVTWEEHNLWYLTRPMKSNEVAETSTMIESSSWGVFQGKIIFIENKQ